MSAPPQIPPRPSRAQAQAPAAGSQFMDVPKIPPRPKRSVDRSVSPNREAFTRSPLNDPTFDHRPGSGQKGSRLSTELPPRPPSVSLPSLGEEGNEYASFEDLSKTLTNQSDADPQQKAQVPGDLPLHAPTASVPSSTAKSRIQTVTRTDSSQAAAAGFGKLLPDDRSAAERSGSSAGGNTRPSSVYKEEQEDEHGIPEIGLQVPMYPNAGDVQAPTPSQYENAISTGVGFFNKTPASGASRNHSRTKSGREVFHGPPGSYGLHGHGKVGNDEFERDWYAKHPEDHKREKAGEYGPHIQENRKDYNWDSHKLDKLVREARAHGAGLGTSREAIATPDEQIGYMATEEYASRMASPQPPSGRPSSMSGKSAPVAESPLRQSNFPVDVLSRPKTQDGEDEDVIHIDPPAHRSSKIHGGGYDPPKEDLGPKGGNSDEAGGWVSERGYGTPILASDQIEKNKVTEWRQPAVSPELERRASGEYTLNEDGQPAYVTKRPSSRSSSRNNNRQRYIPSPAHLDRTGTPLESTKEYEPLFPEDEEDTHTAKAKSPVDKLKKRPDLARHYFPSQDVWEDTPSSLQLETTVDTPQAEEEREPPTPGDVGSAQVFEQPETEHSRKENITKEDQQSFLPEHTRRFANKHLDKDHLSEPTRPGMRQRFPSQDIWEDAPDHGMLETTVSGPQTEETGDYAEDSPVAENQAPGKPTIPSRPQKPKEFSPVEKKAPVLPERPKPQVPVRPSKPLTKSSEKVPTVSSEANAESTSQAKAKPPVPARPAGSKIAALQAGFLQDLNSKLGLGPPKPKEPEPEEEKEPPKPLTDARKGRAKGPQRRKPAASPAPAATVTAEVAVLPPSLKVDMVSTIWQIGDDGALEVPAAEMSAKLHAALAPAEKGDDEPAFAEDTAADEVLEKEQHIQPGEADLEPTTVKDAPSSAIEEPTEASDAPIEGQTAGRTDPVVAEPADAEPVIEDKIPGGFPMENKADIVDEIKKDATEKLVAGGGEEKAEEVRDTTSA